jgi:polyphosphate kinase
VQNTTIPSEISWLSFNSCILDEANDNSNPLYERIKFLAIHSSNLDEFFRVKINFLILIISIKIEIGFLKRIPHCQFFQIIHKMVCKLSSRGHEKP